MVAYAIRAYDLLKKKCITTQHVV